MQITKDKKVYTAGGFATDYPSRGMLAEDDNPMGSVISLSRCIDPACMSVSANKLDECNVCGEPMEPLRVYQPKGFQTVGRAFDFDNSAHVPSKPPKPQLIFNSRDQQQQTVGTAEISFQQDNRLVLINDNNRNLFEFKHRVYGNRVSNQIIVDDPTVYSSRSETAVTNIPVQTSSRYENGAIGALYTADSLMIFFNDKMKELEIKVFLMQNNIQPAQPYSRSVNF